MIISDPEKEIVVHAGEKLKIPCRVDNDPGNRITNITWEKDGNPISVTSEDRIDFGMDGSVTIANVQKRHGGIYRCTATTGNFRFYLVSPQKSSQDSSVGIALEWYWEGPGLKSCCLQINFQLEKGCGSDSM